MNGAAKRALGVGMLGYGSVGRAHINAYHRIPIATAAPPAQTRLVALAGSNTMTLAEAVRRYGFERATTDWRTVATAPDIDLVHVNTPNDLHAEPSIVAAQAGKHVLCEKPLARNGDEARRMWQAVERAGVVHMVSYNYRFVPALRLAHDLIQARRLGTIRQVRGCYLKGSGIDREAPMRWRHRKEIAGAGSLGDLSSHTIDLMRWLVGEISSVHGLARTFVPERPGAGNRLEPVTVDDAALALLEFENGAVGTLEATRLAPGHENAHTIEINGERGSLHWDLERLNELWVYTTDAPPDISGYHDVLVTEAIHPYLRYWWPPGHTIGWEHTFIHQLLHFLSAIVDGTAVAPYAATFEDGYRVAAVVDAILRSAEEGRRVDVEAAHLSL